jgi:hypothetical protein
VSLRSLRFRHVIDAFPKLRRIARRAEDGKRITAAEVVAAFRAAGLPPCDSQGRSWVADRWQRYADAADALTVLLKGHPRFTAGELRRGHNSPALALARRLYGERYAEGFHDGWDDDFRNEEWLPVGECLVVRHPAYEVGFRDGEAARRAVNRLVAEF